MATTKKTATKKKATKKKAAKKKVTKKRAVSSTTKKASSPATKKAAAPKKKRSSSKKEVNPLKQRRASRRGTSNQFPEGQINKQLMVPTMRFLCLRCGEYQHAVWDETRRLYVEKHGGLPCARCGDEEESS